MVMSKALHFAKRFAFEVALVLCLFFFFFFWGGGSTTSLMYTVCMCCFSPVVCSLAWS